MLGCQEWFMTPRHIWVQIPPYLLRQTSWQCWIWFIHSNGPCPHLRGFRINVQHLLKQDAILQLRATDARKDATVLHGPTSLRQQLYMVMGLLLGIPRFSNEKNLV